MAYITLCVSVAPNEKNDPQMVGGLQERTFDNLLERLRALGAECSAILLRLEAGEEICQMRVMSELEKAYAERQFAEIVWSSTDKDIEEDYWVYVIPVK